MEDSYTNTALKAISRALNDGINQRTAMIIIIVVLIVAFTIMAFIIKRRNKKRIMVAAEASYQRLIRKFNLTILELDLIDELSTTLRKPEEKYNLLLSESRFRQAENSLGSFSETKQALIEGLKIKLEFPSADAEQDVISTRLLKNGSPVILSCEDENNLNAEIYSVSESNITIKYPNQRVPITIDDEIQLFINLNGSLRVFKLYPDLIKGELFSSPHAEASIIEKMKLNLDLRMEIDATDSEKALTLKAKILLLTEQGAFIQEKENLLQPGDSLKIFLPNDKKNSSAAYAEVMKISEKRQLASIRFTSLNA